jgi:hypothetical protein
MANDLSGYRWSSYEQYVGEAGICDIDFALGMFSTDRTEAIKFEGMQSERVILKADRAADRN